MWPKMQLSTTEFWITDFPLAPSANNLFVAASNRGNRFVPTAEHKVYKIKVAKWKFENKMALAVISKKLQQAIESGLVLKVDSYFCFHHDRVWTKSKPVRPKQIDANNRLKASLDGLVDCLGIDDKYFWSGIAEKVTTEKEHQQCTIFRIATHSPQSSEEILKKINQP